MDNQLDFATYFKIAYLDPLPKRVMVVLIFSFFCIILFRSSFFRSLQKKLSQISRAYILFSILLLALVLRITWSVLTPTFFPIDQAPASESAAINLHGYQISQKGTPINSDGTLATRRPVGYLYILGGLYALFGYQPYIFNLVQIFLGTMLVWLSYFLGKQLFQNDSIALIVSFLMAIYPQNISSVNIPLDEYPFFVFWFAALILIAKNINAKSVKHTFLISLLIGLATACRTNTYYMPVIFLFSYWMMHLPFQKSVKQAVISMFMIYLISAPWGWITYQHYGKPSFFSTTGLCFYGTLNDRASWHNGYIPRSIEEGGNESILNETNPVKQANLATERAIEWVFKNPCKALQLFFMRNAVLFGFDYSDEIMDLNLWHVADKSSFVTRYHHPIRIFKNWSYSFVFLLGLLGTLSLNVERRYLFWIKYPAFLILILIFFYWAAIHGFFFGFKKYRWAIDLFFLYPASFFIWRLSQTFFSAKKGKLPC